jgi:hypothetical protein
VEPEPPEPELHQNFYPEPEPHKNDAASQHWSREAREKRVQMDTKDLLKILQ